MSSRTSPSASRITRHPDEQPSHGTLLTARTRSPTNTLCDAAAGPPAAIASTNVCPTAFDVDESVMPHLPSFDAFLRITMLGSA